MSSSSSQARKLIPKRLEEDLKNIPKFHPVLREPNRRTVADLMDISAEKAMFDDILGPIVNKKAVIVTSPRISTSVKQTSVSSTSSVSNDSDFNIKLLTRLADAESEIKVLRRQLVEKCSLIDKLENENKSLKMLVDAPMDLADELEEEIHKNEILTQQIADMEQFLKDYGLVWVGHDKKSNESRDSRQFAPIVYADFAVKVDELNRVIHEEPSAIVKDHNGRRARIVAASERLDTVTIVFYQNGLMVKRGPFREVGSASYISFARDIIDGYFPSEYREEYPDGVMFELIDKHTIDLKLEEAGDSAMNTAQFLRRLPKTVIRHGEIVDIRGDIADRLKGPSAAEDKQQYRDDVNSIGGVDAKAAKGLPAPTATPFVGSGKRAQVVLQTAASLLESATDCKSSAEKDYEFCQVQVRWLDGSVVVAKMLSTDSVGDVRAELVKHFASLNSTAGASAAESKENRPGSKITAPLLAFELQTVWPSAALADSTSLRDAGLVPNGTLRACRI